MARLSNKSMKKRLRSLHLNLFFVHYFSTRDLLTISARIAATNSSCLNIKTRLGQKDFDFRNSLLQIFKIDRLDKKANKKSILSFRKLFLFAFYI